jgi:hypothetical protein
MLAELAAANAAFAVIKTALMNGKSIADVGSKVSDYVNATEDLRKLGEKKKRSVLASGGELEEFMHLEKLKQQEEELKQLMIYTGRPGLWGDWVRFQAEARKARLKRAQDRRKKIQHWIEVGLISVLCLALVCTIIGFFYWLAYDYDR